MAQVGYLNISKKLVLPAYVAGGKLDAITPSNNNARESNISLCRIKNMLYSMN
jgi:hypothetical protein